MAYQRLPANGDLARRTVWPLTSTGAGQSGTVTEANQIVVAVNGPGEISGWLRPFVSEFKTHFPETPIFACIVPCTFSSGSERQVVEQIDGIDGVCDARQTWKFILQGRWPPGFHRSRRGVLLHFGGEGMLSLLLAKRFRLPAVAYVERPFFGQQSFDRIFYTGFVPIPRRRLNGRSRIVGDMMMDTRRSHKRVSAATQDQRLTIGLYPGSRTPVVRHALPFFAQLADVVGKRLEVDWVIAKSDFVSLDYLASLQELGSEDLPCGGVDFSLHHVNDEAWLVTEGGTRIRILTAAQAACSIDVALTLPGTSTAELGAMGIPMVVVLGTQLVRRPEVFPLPGLAGHLDRVPLVGRPLKSLAARSLLRAMPHLSHPNRRAGRQIVPELVGEITVEDVASSLVDTATTNRETIAADLRRVMGAPGAASRLVEQIGRYVRGKSAAPV